VVDNNLPAGQNTTTYAYDTASNLVTVTYPNGLQSTIQYDSLNRLTSLASSTASYNYQLGATGNRTGATEQSGRTLAWNYDGIYRLTSEAVGNDPSGGNGEVDYTLDPVGNRTSTNSSLPGVHSVALSGFNLDDWLSPETYDANGNTLTTGGKTFAYDSENHLMSMNGGAVTMIYDGFGNRVSKTVGNVTTKYLVEDDVNPTGLPQVFEESVNGVVLRTYTYGLQRISENQVINNAWTTSFYGYDGFGSVRQLTNLSGTITDTYNYDAFGNLLSSPGPTPNNYLYRGEQYDPDLGLYYLRARYYNPASGRFMSRDPEDGKIRILATLHKYLYAFGDPVNRIDPRGRESMLETGSLDAIIGTTPVPALVELAGGAMASAAAVAVSGYLAAIDTATTAAIATADFFEALGWVKATTGITKVLLCVAAEVKLGDLFDKWYGAEGASNNIPSGITDKFEEVCLGLVGPHW
jgi:RHS repeat-associated protein